MILDSQAKIEVLRVLSGHVFDHLSITEIIHKTNLGKTWCYKSVKELQDVGIVARKNNLYSLNMENLLSLDIFKALSVEKIYLLPEEIRKKVLDIYQKIRLEFKDSLAAALLIGSTARLTRTSRSDIDFLIIANPLQKWEITSDEEFNLIVLSKEDLEQKYLECDDFVISALQNGILLFDTNYLIDFFKKPLPFPSQQKIVEKKIAIRGLVSRVYDFIKIDDTENALLDLKHALSQAARIILLDAGKIPRSRAELPHQLDPLDPWLANKIRRILDHRTLNKKQILDICQNLEEKFL